MALTLRQLPGALGMALLWAVGWAATAFALMAVTLLAVGGRELLVESLAPIVVVAGLAGLVGGAALAVVLGSEERRRRLSALRPGRQALWGAVSGLLVPLGLVAYGAVAGVPLEVDVAIGVTLMIAALGAATAGGTVLLARMAERRLDPGGDDPPGR